MALANKNARIVWALLAHIRKTTRAEPRQQRIYDALGILDQPGRTEKTMI